MIPKKVTVLFFAFFVAVSCYNYNKPDKPNNLISKKQMVNILLDLKLINAVTGKDKNVLDSAKLAPERYVYKKHNIDSAQFAQSNAYYAYHMEDYNAIYEQVKDSLKKLQAHYEIVMEEELMREREKDSLKRIEKAVLKAQTASPHTLQTP